jgi:hypothetical protein
MSRASRVGLALLASAVVLGVLGDALFQGQRLGLNVGVWTACFVAALAWLVRLARAPLHHPDAVIARTNINRPRVDVAYLAQLSDDAVPTLVARLDRLDPAGRRLLAAQLARRSPSSGDWRSWNVSRSRAARVLAQHRVELAGLAERGP